MLEQSTGMSIKNLGPVAMDAKWAEYSAYLERMIQMIDEKWNGILSSSKMFPPVGSSVIVKFRLNREGHVAEIIDVDSTSNMFGKEACISAITAPAPYGKWTDEMVKALGESQEMTFRFFYVPQ